MSAEMLARQSLPHKTLAVAFARGSGSRAETFRTTTAQFDRNYLIAKELARFPELGYHGGSRRPIHRQSRSYFLS